MIYIYFNTYVLFYIHVLFSRSFFLLFYHFGSIYAYAGTLHITYIRIVNGNTWINSWCIGFSRVKFLLYCMHYAACAFIQFSLVRCSTQLVNRVLFSIYSKCCILEGKNCWLFNGIIWIHLCPLLENKSRNKDKKPKNTEQTELFLSLFISTLSKNFVTLVVSGAYTLL